MIIEEGKAKIHIESDGKISKKLHVFYNPIMTFNRDVSILLLKSLNREMQICDLLAGSGIRSIRFLKELPEKTIKTISINDYQADFFPIMEKNFQLNGIDDVNYISENQYQYSITSNNKNINKKLQIQKINVFNEEANVFLLKSNGFDYTDVDPFGSPNSFLDTAIKRLARDGILAVTATDIAALAGTYRNPGKRKYWAVPLKNELMHEIGLRILVRKVQLIGAQYDKALFPVLSYAKDHYFRIYFHCEKSKEKVDAVLKQHLHFVYFEDLDFFAGSLEQIFIKIKEKNQKYQLAGPLYAGSLQDGKLIAAMVKKTEDKKMIQFLEVLKNEENCVGFYSVNSIAKKYKIKNMPKLGDLIKKSKGTITHFAPNALKTKMNIEEVLKLIR
ncbi:hypothetical protein C4573_05030 [Candidatus Woesearchaeota archaeon]|nr:MAG: hypothetical protein C4573_05030 [Candidatus Woesearchaeota archaeon]